MSLKRSSVDRGSKSKADESSAKVDRQDLWDELSASLPRIVVHNKCDLAGVAPHVQRSSDARDTSSSQPAAHVWLCALTGDGVDALEATVQAMAGVEHVSEDAFFARERQLLALRDAADHLDRANAHVDSQQPAIELFAEELRAAQHAFGSITGEFTSDDLLGEIFSRFCIGK